LSKIKQKYQNLNETTCKPILKFKHATQKASKTQLFKINIKMPKSLNEIIAQVF